MKPDGKTCRPDPADVAALVDVDDFEDIIPFSGRTAFSQPQKSTLRAQQCFLVFPLPGDEHAEILPEKDIERIEADLENLAIQVVYPHGISI